MHQAALCVRMAQTMLPGVQFPYCTSREVFAILQVHFTLNINSNIWSKRLIYFYFYIDTGNRILIYRFASFRKVWTRFGSL